MRLKSLRNRAHVTALTCAKAAHLSSPNSWYRYENVDRMGDTPIPDHIIEAIMHVVVGRGMPPVTADELLSISSAHRLLSVRGKAAVAGQPQPNSMLPQPVMAPVFPDVNTAPPLVVRYRAERGVYMDMAAIHKRTFGTAPITAATDIKGEQFCVLVADGLAAGTLLQCVVPSVYTSEQMKGRRVVVIETHEKMKLGTVSVGKVESVSGNRVKIVDQDGNTLTGTIYGVVVGSYARE